MKTENNDMSGIGPEELVRLVDNLAAEIKLQAINLAIVLAQTQHANKSLKDLEPQFGELISKANKTSRQIGDVVKAFQGGKKMIGGLPESSDSIAKRGAYDRLEATLNHIYDLSRNLVESINRIKQQQAIG